MAKKCFVLAVESDVSAMLATARILLKNGLGSLASSSTRSLSITAVNNVKEIKETKSGKTLIIEGVVKPSDREPLLVKPEDVKIDDKKPCYMCALDLNVKHTDVLILSQFVRSDGCMLPRRITGLCSRQQKLIGTMVSMAQKAGLMINITPNGCKKDPKKRRDWKKFYSYYDESTILKYEKKPKRGLFRYLNNY